MNSVSTAFVFPGQGSQSPGMLAEFIDEPFFQKSMHFAEEVLGQNLIRLITEGSQEELDKTENTQPLLLAASVSLWHHWLKAGGFRPAVMAGHSLGEYSALTAAGALDFGEALLLVRRRAQLMQQAVPKGQGAMAAVLGLDEQAVAESCSEASHSTQDGAFSANFNALGQVVIAGSALAVERAIEICRSRGAKKAMKLPVSVPSHCPLMAPAAKIFAEHLNAVKVTLPTIPVVHNVNAQTSTRPEEIRQRLLTQLTHPVLWTKCVAKMSELGASQLVECGPGTILSALNRRIDRSLSSVAFGREGQFKTLLASGV